MFIHSFIHSFTDTVVLAHTRARARTHTHTHSHTHSHRSLGNPLLANKTPTFVPPSSEELSCAMTVGIDAEFVALTAEETGPVALGSNRSICVMCDASCVMCDV